jgi:carboxyl-terminal processing protease
MFPASVRGPGESIAFPDVCLTPPVPTPVPYLNVGMHSTASGASVIVNICGMAALNIMSYLPSTTGDEAGSSGGVKSGTIKGPGYFLAGSPVVYIEKLPAVRLTSRISGNTENANGLVAIPGQAVVYVAFDGTREGIERLRRGTPFATQLLRPGVGLVRIDRFASDAVRLFFQAQARLAAEGARVLVLDLRGCPGGDLEAAYALAAEFLPEGASLGSVVDDDGDATERVAPRNGPYGFPVVLLVDRDTKSAAEVFVGALAHHDRAVVVGGPTFGKTSVQCAVPTLDGGLHVATCAQVVLPGAHVARPPSA